MDSYTFAGFTFPRQVPRLVRERFASPRTGRPMARRLCTAYRTVPTINPGPSNESGFYLASDFAPGLRWEWCDEIEDSPVDHKGWFSDPDESSSETIRGFVMRLPRGRGFLAGHAMGEGMLATLSRTVHDSEREAARAADRMAESAAEAERDYQEGWQAGNLATELGEEAADARGRALALLRDMRAARRNLAGEAGPALCAELRTRVESLVETWRDKRAERDRLVSQWSGHDGFANAYGEG